MMLGGQTRQLLVTWAFSVGADCQAVSYTGKLGPATDIGHFNVCSQGDTELDRMPYCTLTCERMPSKDAQISNIVKICQDIVRQDSGKICWILAAYSKICTISRRYAKICNICPKNHRDILPQKMPNKCQDMPRYCRDVAKMCQEIPKILPRHDMACQDLAKIWI